MAHCSELNSVPSWYTTHNTQWTNKRMNERMNEEGWGEKNKQRKWPSQLLCASFAPIFCWFLSLSVSGFLFGSVLFCSVRFDSVCASYRSWYTVPLFSVQSYVQFISLSDLFQSHFYFIFSWFGWMKRQPKRMNEQTNLLQFALICKLFYFRKLLR